MGQATILHIRADCGIDFAFLYFSLSRVCMPWMS